VPTQRGGSPPVDASHGADRDGCPLPVSVVICTYDRDRWRDLVAAIESVVAQTDGDGRQGHEVVVVVDHNPTLATTVRSRFPDCVVIENRFGRGLSGARNTGVAAAKGDVVLFLDDDAVATEGWLAAHVAAYSPHDVVGTAGVVRPAWDAGTPPQWWPETFDWVVGCNDQRIEPSGALVRNPIGANMGFRRASIVDAGGFSDRLGRTSDAPLGCEETELAIRISQRQPGAQIVSVPDAVCLHRVPQDRVTWKYFRRRCVAEGRSKAVVARLSGFGAATSSERRYTSRVLPSAMSSAVLHGNLRRALAMVAGVCFAVVGFVPALVDSSESFDDERHAHVFHLEAGNADSPT
jgi:glucosyl-dolichyl phosphate glucuronosyltransferase